MKDNPRWPDARRIWNLFWRKKRIAIQKVVAEAEHQLFTNTANFYRNPKL